VIRYRLRQETMLSENQFGFFVCTWDVLFVLFNAILLTYKKNSFNPKCSAIEPIFLFRHPMEKYIEKCVKLYI
jgi:hypothetical protein